MDTSPDKTKPTDPPWTAEHNCGRQLRSYSQSSAVMAGPELLVCGCFFDIPGGEARAAANANLMAASHDLLAACKEARTEVRNDSEAYAMLTAAIAKAEGTE